MSGHKCKCKNEVLIVSAYRTPIGSFGGALKDYSATDLGGMVITEAVERNIHHLPLPDMAVSDSCQIFIGNVLSTGLGQNPARQAAHKAGLPWTIPCATVNKVCGSGLEAIKYAYNAIKADATHLVIAGGMESMSNAPYATKKRFWHHDTERNTRKLKAEKLSYSHEEIMEATRSGKFLFENPEDSDLIDILITDGLWDPYSKKHMGDLAAQSAKTHGISREEQDEYARTSNERAIKTVQKGLFGYEIIPVDYFKEDEGIKQFKPEKMPTLSPVFGETITAANSSKISDGAAMLIITSSEIARDYKLFPLAKITDICGIALDPRQFPEAPGAAINELLTRNRLKIEDIDLWEINEAFAAVPLIAIKTLKIPPDKLNVHGGALALGHPLGASGARIVVTLLHAMGHYGKKLGVAAICIGGGEALAVLVERV